MSDNRKAIADAFGREIDPLAQYTEIFETTDADAFSAFIEDVLEPKNTTPKTVRGYERTIREWRSFMNEQGRHPATPHEDHVKAFTRREIDEKGNSTRTAKKKLWHLNAVYQYWQSDAAFPHSSEYNPFQVAKKKLSLSTERVKDPPRIPVSTLREILGDVTHVRDRALIAMQLKLGLRATEIANIKLSELDITDHEVQRHYTDMGTASQVARFEDAVFIPSDRPGNKSERPRMLPIDDEMRRVLTNYLLVRPDADEPWMFLSRTNHTRIDDETVNLAWKRAFHPEYAETSHHRAVTSHYGRHRFTTYWRVEQDMNRELIKYMRGDTSAGGPTDRAGGIDNYIHSYYEDIEPLYRERIYKLGV